MEAEGDLYRLQECAESALADFARIDKFIADVIAGQGLKKTAGKLAAIFRRRCGNEDNQTFTMTIKQLEESMIELRKNLLSETIEGLVKKGHLIMFIDQEGNIIFEPAKGGGGSEPQKP